MLGLVCYIPETNAINSYVMENLERKKRTYFFLMMNLLWKMHNKMKINEIIIFILIFINVYII